MRKLIATTFVTALLLSPHSFTFLTNADATARVRGHIRSVDVTAGTVTIHTRNDETVVLKTNERTQITRNGERATLEDLRPSDRAVAQYDPETMVAAEISARGEDVQNLARVEGVITEVDTAAGTLTIDPRPGSRSAGAGTTAAGDPVTLGVTANTAITLDGRPARLDDLRRGFSAGASYDPRTFEAVRIAAESLAEVRGVIRDVDLARQSLTIASAAGDEVVTLQAGPNTSISLNGRPATLEDLRRGFQVIAAYIQSTLQAVRVAAESLGEVAGHIRAVDVAASIVIITPLVDGAPVELQVSRDTRITIGGEPASLERLRPGMPATALFNIVSFVALSIDARPLPDEECTEQRVAGRISNVDLRASTVTIDASDSTSLESVTLNVVDRTEITIGGNPARLSDLRDGMRVRAVFCRESLVAKSIAVRLNR